MAVIVGITNQKGGVGKTATAINLSACLAATNKKTLLVDMDPQANSTSGLGIDRNSLNYTSYQVILNEVEPQEVILPTPFPNLSVLPASLEVIGAEVELVNEHFKEYRLRSGISKLQAEYDFIIIDAPPSLSLLTVNVLTAARWALIPVQCEYYALEGLSLLLTTINRIRERLNNRLEIIGILMTMFDSRTNLSRQVVDEVRHHFPDKVFDTVIPRSVRVSEAPSHGKPLLYYDFRSTASQAYINLTREFLPRCQHA